MTSFVCGLLAVCASCTGVVEGPTETVLIGLEQGELRVVGSGPRMWDLVRVNAGASRLAYELLDPQGQLVAQGQMDDPRSSLEEVFGVEGPAHVRAGVAFSAVELPHGGGTLRLLDPGSGAEVDRVSVPAAGDRRPMLLSGTHDADVLGAPVHIGGNGQPETSVTLLVLAEGYTDAELDQFHDDAKALVASFRAQHSRTSAPTGTRSASCARTYGRPSPVWTSPRTAAACAPHSRLELPRSGARSASRKPRG